MRFTKDILRKCHAQQTKIWIRNYPFHCMYNVHGKITLKLDQVVKPPMMADSDLTAPLLGDLSLGSSSSDNVFEAPPDKRRGRPTARPRSKSHVLVTGEERKRIPEGLFFFSVIKKNDVFLPAVL